jgi:hypothetical protein
MMIAPGDSSIKTIFESMYFRQEELMHWRTRKILSEKTCFVFLKKYLAMLKLILDKIKFYTIVMKYMIYLFIEQKEY